MLHLLWVFQYALLLHAIPCVLPSEHVRRIHSKQNLANLIRVVSNQFPSDFLLARDVDALFAFLALHQRTLKCLLEQTAFLVCVGVAFPFRGLLTFHSVDETSVENLEPRDPCRSRDNLVSDQALHVFLTLDFLGTKLTPSLKLEVVNGYQVKLDNLALLLPIYVRYWKPNRGSLKAPPFEVGHFKSIGLAEFLYGVEPLFH